MADGRHVNAAGRELVQRFEGVTLSAYQCPAGRWTIGWGHTKGVKAFDTCCPGQAEVMLDDDLAEAAAAVERYVKVPLSDSQFAALVSWTFNLGGGALRVSTLLRRLNAGEYWAVPEEMKRWTKACVNGRLTELPGLVKRRAAEAALWEAGSTKQDLVPEP